MTLRTVRIGDTLVQGPCQIEGKRNHNTGKLDPNGMGIITDGGTTYRGELIPQTWKEKT